MCSFSHKTSLLKELLYFFLLTWFWYTLLSFDKKRNQIFWWSAFLVSCFFTVESLIYPTWNQKGFSFFTGFHIYIYFHLSQWKQILVFIIIFSIEYILKTPFWNWWEFILFKNLILEILLSKNGMQHMEHLITFAWKWSFCRILIVVFSKSTKISYRNLCLLEGSILPSLDASVSVSEFKYKFSEHFPGFSCWVFFLFLLSSSTHLSFCNHLIYIITILKYL